MENVEATAKPAEYFFVSIDARKVVMTNVATGRRYIIYI